MDHPLAPYPSPEAREREFTALLPALQRAGLAAEAQVYGASVEGRPLQVMRVRRSNHDGGDDERPRVLVCANIHGPEYIGNRVAIAMLQALAAPSPLPLLTRLLDRAELWVAPCLNPDGYARTYAREGQGKLAALRHNAHGVDLNRNWPLPPGTRRLPFPGAGSPHPGAPTYRGPAPLSEPETASLDRLLTRARFHAGANLHSFMGTLFPARVLDRGGFAGYRSLCRSFRRGQERTRYLRLASRAFDTFTGEQEDHQHHVHGCWAICVESFPVLASLRQHPRAPSLFWRFNPHDPAAWVANDLPGVTAYLLAALDLPRPSAGR